MESKNHFIATKELILKHNKHSGNAETFVYEPSNIEEDPLGNLYIIGRVNSNRKELSFITNLVASLMRREFYRPGGDGSPETKFESGLKKANSALLDIEAANANVASDIELCIVNIAQDKVRVSQVGNLITLLYRDDEIININPKDKSVHKKEFFSSVIAGDIQQNDKFIFSTGKLIDLFSDEGLKKLGALNIEKQADIMSRLYQKNQQEMSLPDQAAILLEIKDHKKASVFSLKKRIAINPPPVKKYISRVSSVRLSKKGKIISASLFFLIVALSIYLPIQSQYSKVRKISEQIRSADEISPADKESAAALLKDAQKSTAPLLSVWYLAGTAQKLANDINDKINALNGIYKETPAEWAKFDMGAVNFKPRYIFDGGDNIYIFSSSADMVYKIKKYGKSSSFTPLHTGDGFTTERMFEDGGYIYLINDTGKSAYIFYPETEETAPVIKSLKKILATLSKQNSRTTESAIYYFDGLDKIIKEMTADKLQIKLLLDPPTAIIDFAISKDGKNIYLLSKDKILSINNK